MDDTLKMFEELLMRAFAPVNPKTGKVIQFSLARGQHTYNYYAGQNGKRHCYTPHPDTEGNYWVWTYLPKGKGARSGAATTFTMRSLVRCAHRKTAISKARARARKKDETRV